MTDNAQETPVKAPQLPVDGLSEIPEGDVPETDETVVTDDGPEPDTFPREYVEKLRAESAEYRVRAKRADDLAERLQVALVAATGRLADPRDLPFDPALIEDESALSAAIDALLADRPHLAARRPVGGVGQGPRAAESSVSLSSLLRSNA